MSKYPYKIVAISGSLRKESKNKKLLTYCFENSPSELDIEIIDISTIPLFNQDIEDAGFPESVLHLRKKVREADGLLLGCPEYNTSVSGVLKNAIDWISRRDPDGYPFSRKPVMIVGATTGRLGTARAQKELRVIMANLNTFPMNKPELFVAEAKDHIDSQGLQDENMQNILDKMMINFIKWIETLKK